ncbi:Resistance to inhibitors of cholinesterase protein 3 [Clonorchis sinensis]|uniref:Resistance to inhibitors of cholinesterase protein 3 n=1 Tax=Clonorchis sinensis TaxID=79923 RepID=A0A8T1MYN9_CLOSI|nr:Resistance to inhibitors of cholinesterase protein 3 [Clonorchis sinensis]
MSDSSIRLQTYVVCGVMIGCFSLLYPRIFHPMLMHALGFSKATSSDADSHHLNRPPFDPHGAFNRPRPTIRAVDVDTQKPGGKRGGLMSVVLPVYAVGIVLYLIYTLSKIYRSRNRKNKDNKEEFLRHYYRDFHYDTRHGKFRMGHGSSDEGEEDEESEDIPKGSLGLLSSTRASRLGKPKFTNKDGRFDWAAAYGAEGQRDIFRSAKSLPRDLEALLLKIESEDVVNHDEFTALRIRLEQTEKEMTRLLSAMNQAERMVGRFDVDDDVDTQQFDGHVAAGPAQEDTEYEATASEDELDSPTGVSGAQSTQLESID